MKQIISVIYRKHKTVITLADYKAWDVKKTFDENAWTRGSPPGMPYRPRRC